MKDNPIDDILSNAKLKSRIMTLFVYDLKDMPSSKKVRFVYLMKGRNEETGIVERLNGEYISSSSFIVHLANEDEIIQIMGLWGVSYKKRRIMLID